MILVKPSRKLKDEILDYKQEYIDAGETHINGSYGLMRYQNVDEWLDAVISIEKDRLSGDGIHASTFFSVREDDNRIIGTVQLRHTLTEELEKHAGHIGYGIRPSERRKGYGKQQLLLALEAARNLGIPKVMLTCDKDNLASSRVIASCGGVLFCENTYEGVKQQVFWIQLMD